MSWCRSAARSGSGHYRQVDSIAGTIGDGRGIEIDRSRCESRRVLAGADNVAEGEGVGAGAAGIDRGAAVIESEARRAAGDRYRLAQRQASASRSCRHPDHRSKVIPRSN